LWETAQLNQLQEQLPRLKNCREIRRNYGRLGNLIVITRGKNQVVITVGNKSLWIRNNLKCEAGISIEAGST
jgi:hypothetical protein